MLGVGNWISALRLWVTIGLIAGNVHAAEVEFDENCLFLSLSGEIVRESLVELRRGLESRACQARRIEAENGWSTGFIIFLDSPGGDVNTAIEIGRVFRKWHAYAQVNDEAICASACVLMLVGAVDRGVQGKIGLHRPFSDISAHSSEDAARRYREIRDRVKSYLEEMNIPDRLLDSMNSTGPQNVRWLSGYKDQRELEELWIEAKDPVFEDMQLSRKALELGISKKELIGRVQRARNICYELKELKKPSDYASRDKCRREIIEKGR